MTQDVAAVLFDRDGRKPAPGMAAGVRTMLVPTRHTRSLLGTGRV